LAPLLVMFGWTNLASQKALISPHDLRRLIGDRTHYATVQGVLRETPIQRVYEHDAEESWRTQAQMEVTFLQTEKDDWQPAFGRLIVSTPGVLPGYYFAGQSVQISGVLRRPKGPLAEGLFDYRAYLERIGIYYQLQVGNSNDWQRLAAEAASAKPPMADRFAAWAKKILALGLPVEDEPLRLLWTMTLGWKTALNNEVAEPFMRSGTMHIFAISGLHIALLAGILVSVLRVLRVPRGACGLIVIPLIWFYTGVTGWQASAIRSTVMMTVIIAGWSLKRPADLLNSLATAAFLILVWDPRQLFQASFQLSFFVVLSLALFVPVLEKLRKRLWQPDPFLPDELRPRWQRWLGPPARFVTASFLTSLAAWLGSIPLVAYYFHLFTPVSLLANLIVVPLSSAALASNLASLIVGGWFPACAELFNHSAWFWMWLMIRVCEWSAQLDGGWFNIAAPSLVAFVLYYALLIAVMAGWLRRPRLRIWVSSALAVVTLVWLGQWQRDRAIVRVTILPLNGGDAVFLDQPDRLTDWLIDCGNVLAAEFVTKPFLRAQGVNRLSHLLLTHGDLQHVGGAQFIRENFRPKEICASPVRFRSPAYRKVLEGLGTGATLVKTIKRGDQIEPWTVLHPDAEDNFPQADDNAVVLRAEIHSTSILLLSDLGRPGQNALIQRGAALKSDILVAGLPRQSEPLADALIDAIQPRVIIITDAEFPATERASPSLRERLAQRQLPVIYTRETGSIRITFSSDGCEVHPMIGTPLHRPQGRMEFVTREAN
jgi:DNA internalization-related competence protein ComEC/Rec2